MIAASKGSASNINDRVKKKRYADAAWTIIERCVGHLTTNLQTPMVASSRVSSASNNLDFIYHLIREDPVGYKASKSERQ